MVSFWHVGNPDFFLDQVYTQSLNESLSLLRLCITTLSIYDVCVFVVEVQAFSWRVAIYIACRWRSFLQRQRFSATCVGRGLTMPSAICRRTVSCAEYCLSAFVIRPHQLRETIAVDDPSICLFVCLSCRQDVQKWLNGSTSCLGWRHLGSQET